MQKTTNILFTIAFTIGCFGLWFLLCTFECIYPQKWLHTGYLPRYTNLLLAWKFLFLVIPIPFLLVSAFVALRKRPTTEFNLCYVGILAVIFSFLFFSVAVVVLLPWIQSIE